RRLAHLRYAVHARGVRGAPALGPLAAVGRHRDRARGQGQAAVLVPPRADALRRRQRQDPRRRARVRGRSVDHERVRGPRALAGGSVKITFWGVRGSVPAPGPETNRYGGNTSCVSIQTADDKLIIIDMGTGLMHLGNALMAGAFGKGAGRASILLSHTHWDHIQGLGFFAPV